VGVAPGRIAPASAPARFENQPVAGADLEADFLGLDCARRTPLRMKRIAMRYAVGAAEAAAGAVAHAVAGGVADGRLGGLDHHLDYPARSAAILAGAAGIRAELVAAEEQREAHLCDLEAAELDPARRLPFAGTGPAVARRRGAAAGPRLEEVPDKRLASRDVGAWVPALDRDAEAAAPAGHRAVGTGRRQRLDDRLDDLLADVIGGEGPRR